jgi:hypothetical protein
MSNVLKVLDGYPKSKTAEWVRAHLDYDLDFCLIWPFSSAGNGYPKFGENVAVHRLMCEHRNGPPPTPGHHAAHSCNNGVRGCVNPKHVSWKTRSENMRDSLRRGELLRKLTPEQVDEIRALHGRMPIIEIAAKFGVRTSTIRGIVTGKTWRNPAIRRRTFSPDEVAVICSRTVSAKKLAAQYGASESLIHRIRNGTAVPA